MITPVQNDETRRTNAERNPKAEMKMKTTRAAITKVAKAVEALLPEIRTLIEQARHRAVAAANLSMVSLYWNIGRVVNTELQRRPGRADYGGQIIERLAVRLSREYGPGFSAPNLWDMK